MKIAIITRPNDSSPKVLAQSLNLMLSNIGVESQIFYEAGLLMRLVKWYKKEGNLYKKLKYRYAQLKLQTNINDFLTDLSHFDIIVFCECAPNGFWRDYYGIEQLKKKLKKPIVFYEVYYLGNAPTQIDILKKEGDFTTELYDWHFAVSDITEIRTEPSILNNWSRIGLNLTNTNLSYKKKKEFLVLIDFEQPGYKSYRDEQIKLLEELSIPYIALAGRYPMLELREIYNMASVCFIQSPEAFGVPIAELFSAGSYIFTPDSSWPMSWRLDEEPEIHGTGILPDIFKVYDGISDLKNQLIEIKKNWDKESTPKYVFKRFTEVYPHFYYGDSLALQESLNAILRDHEENSIH